MKCDLKVIGKERCTCGNDEYMAVSQRVFRGVRWALICTTCGKRWKFANEREKLAINARLKWVEENGK